MRHAVGGSFGGGAGRLLGGVEAGIVDGAGAVPGQFLGQREVISNEAALGAGTDEGHGAENEAMGGERHDEHGTAAHPMEQAGVFVVMRDSTPAVAALHPVNGFLILFLAIVLARDSWMMRTAPAPA